MMKLYRLLRYEWPLHFVLLITNWLPDNVIFFRIRGLFVRPFLGSCGNNLRLGRNIAFLNPTNIHVGEDVFFAYGVWFAAAGDIHIGDEVMIGPYVVISAGNHTREKGSFRYGNPEILNISIGRGTWVGANSTILGGADIGQGSLIGSGAVVIRGNYPDDSFLAGVPAVVRKPILDNKD